MKLLVGFQIGTSTRSRYSIAPVTLLHSRTADDSSMACSKAHVSSRLVLVAVAFSAVGVLTITAGAAGGLQLRKLLYQPRALRIFNVTAALLLVASIYPMFAPMPDAR
jgi:hypothetical protein